MRNTGLTFGASDSIELLVQGEDSDGTIAKLQLYRGNYKVAEAAPGPLRYTLRNVPSGSYAFTARAIDNSGAVTTSSSVGITISASGATVSLVGAQPFFTSSPGALVANITGINPGALSSLTLNGTAVPLRSGEFLLYPALTEGENTFTLLANGSVSASTKVYLDSTMPTIAISKPINNSTFTAERINVTGTFTEKGSVLSIDKCFWPQVGPSYGEKIAQGNDDVSGVDCTATADGNENTFEPLLYWSSRSKK